MPYSQAFFPNNETNNKFEKVLSKCARQPEIQIRNTYTALCGLKYGGGNLYRGGSV